MFASQNVDIPQQAASEKDREIMLMIVKDQKSMPAGATKK
jgi:hypothetical protein